MTATRTAFCELLCKYGSLDFFEYCSFAIHVNVLADACSFDVTVTQDHLNVSVVDIQFLLGLSRWRVASRDCDAAKSMTLAEPRR